MASNDEVIEVVPIQSSMMVGNAEIDMQIATAHKYPRSVQKFKQNAMSLATTDEHIAESMFYVLPRGGKNIEGPSVRLAEIIATTWGNMRVESDIAEVGDTHVTAIGSAIDLESNTAARIRVKRRITGRDGRRFNDDMITTVSNAAMSIAYREAVFKIVPRAMFQSIYEESKKTAVGSAATLTQRRDKALEWFASQGVTKAQIFSKLGINGIEDIDLKHLETLTGIKSAIKEGEISAVSAFTVEEATVINPAMSGASRAMAAFQSKKNGTEAEVRFVAKGEGNE